MVFDKERAVFSRRLIPLVSPKKEGEGAGNGLTRKEAYQNKLAARRMVKEDRETKERTAKEVNRTIAKLEKEIAKLRKQAEPESKRSPKVTGKSP